MPPQVPNHIETPDAVRAGMAAAFALYREGAFGEIAPSVYPMSDAASLHEQVERPAFSGIAMLVPSGAASTAINGRSRI